MADNFCDVRTKVSAATHAVLSAYATATGREISEIVRELVKDFADQQVRTARMIVSVAIREGTVGNRGERTQTDGEK